MVVSLIFLSDILFYFNLAKVFKARTLSIITGRNITRISTLLQNARCAPGSAARDAPSFPSPPLGKKWAAACANPPTHTPTHKALFAWGRPYLPKLNTTQNTTDPASHKERKKNTLGVLHPWKLPQN